MTRGVSSSNLGTNPSIASSNYNFRRGGVQTQSGPDPAQFVRGIPYPIFRVAQNVGGNVGEESALSPTSSPRSSPAMLVPQAGSLQYSSSVLASVTHACSPMHVCSQVFVEVRLCRAVSYCDCRRLDAYAVGPPSFTYPTKSCALSSHSSSRERQHPAKPRLRRPKLC